MAFTHAGEGTLPARGAAFRRLIRTALALVLSVSIALPPVAPALAQSSAPASQPTATAASASPPVTDGPGQPEAKEVVLLPVQAGETALAATPAALVATGQDPGKPAPEVPFTGSYNYSIPITVPAFRGLEPKLRLTYSSSRGAKGGTELVAGWLGAGWSLEGYSSIQRKTKRLGGVPAYGAGTDGFYLDGEELIPCAEVSIVSASCVNLGTHTTKTESYRLIVYNSTANTFTVTEKDGTASTYVAVGSLTGADAVQDRTDPNGMLLSATNYVLSTVRDTSGNTVSWGYTCLNFALCYPRAVTYNGTTIAFRLGARDLIVSSETLPPNAAYLTRGTGSSIVTIAHQLRHIDITTNGQRARTYQLVYFNFSEPQSTRHTMRLQSVLESGRDTVIDANGTVTTRSTLPIHFTYALANPVTPRTLSASLSGVADTQIVDINGDQRGDMIRSFCFLSCRFQVWISAPDGLSSTPINYDSDMDLPTNSRIGYNYYLTGDFDGLGRQQMMLVYLWVNQTTGATGWRFRLYTFDPVTGAPTGRNWHNETTLTGSITAGDFDGDGRMEIMIGQALFRSYGATATRIALPEFAYCGYYAANTFYAADFTGDGRTDLACYETSNYGSFFRLYRSEGSSFTALDMVSVGAAPKTIVTGDFNGDGLSDLLFFRIDPDSNSYSTWRLLSTGRSFSADRWLTSVSYSGEGAVAADFDGDGTTDLSYSLSYAPTQYYTCVTGYSKCEFLSTLPPGNKVVASDVNGDGAAEAISLNVANSQINYHSYASLQRQLIAGVSTPYGGKTTIAYEPSTVTTNTHLPMVLQRVKSISTNDGRGMVATTSYTYSGGLWSQAERRFLGFRNVRAWQPCNAGETGCPSQLYTFRQDLPAAGEIEAVQSLGGGTTLRHVAQTWTDGVRQCLKSALSGPQYPYRHNRV